SLPPGRRKHDTLAVSIEEHRFTEAPQLLENGAHQAGELQGANDTVLGHGAFEDKMQHLPPHFGGRMGGRQRYVGLARPDDTDCPLDDFDATEEKLSAPETQ